jgi:hypothetical protein
VFTARYALNPSVKQICPISKELNIVTEFNVHTVHIRRIRRILLLHIVGFSSNCDLVSAFFALIVFTFFGHILLHHLWHIKLHRNFCNNLVNGTIF